MSRYSDMRVGATLASGSPPPQAAVPAFVVAGLQTRASLSCRCGVPLLRRASPALQRTAVFEAISMLVSQVTGYRVQVTSLRTSSSDTFALLLAKNEIEQRLCSCFIRRARSSNALLPASY